MKFKIPINGIKKLTLLTLTLTSVALWSDVARPIIWVQPEDRQELLTKIETHDWAQSLYDQLKARADAAIADHQADRDAFLRALPLNWSAGQDEQPMFRTITGSESDRYIMMPYIQDAVDCGIVYFLTEDDRYAQCAADIVGVFVSALSRMERSTNLSNGGLIYPSDHLKEARIIGAQVPVAYDFIQPFVAGGGKVYDLVTGGERDFPYADAQDTFMTYVEMAIEVGHTGSNWSVLEAASLVGNTLALDEESKIQEYLEYYLTRQSTRQDPLSTVAQSYPNPGDIWPESLQYSRGVADLSVYLMTMLDRIYPDLKLGSAYPNIIEALSKDYLLRYPNNDVISFGDGHRSYGTDYQTYENAYTLATISGNERLIEMFGSLLNRGLSSREYDRSTLPSRSNGAHPYLTPVNLLWSTANVIGTEEENELPRTVELPFAGIYLQRNLSEANLINNSLMAFVGGGQYVHGHASGMNIELYGQGSVLGIDPGPSTYRTDIHENYYRIFAAHNTIISNGGSASQGGWANLGINQLELQSMEPMPETEAVSSKYSFSTTRFEDEHNLVAEAEQVRTLAIVRTSDTTGYYVDVYRSRSDTAGEFHDYLYHNIGESLEFIDSPEGFAMSPDPDRFKESASLPWNSNNTFRHPGWHFFEEVESSTVTDASVTAEFVAKNVRTGTVSMKVFMNEGSDRTYTSVMSPEAKNGPGFYAGKKVPALVVRQEGEAWTNPFAFVYEPTWSLGILEMSSIQSVESLMEENRFRGLVVKSEVEGEIITQYILVLENSDEVYNNPDLGISFTGHFGIITLDGNDELESMYIGDGQSLQYGDDLLTPEGQSSAAEWTTAEQVETGWVDTGDFMGWLEISYFPFCYSLSLDGWIYLDNPEANPESGSWIYVYRS